MAERAQTLEAHLWKRAGIVPGALVADVGCGPAALSICMARVVGPSGRVVGLERDETALAAAHQLLGTAEVQNVELRQGNAHSTGLSPDSIDVAVMRYVLAHNGPDGQPIVNHLSEVARPGGSVYLVDIDGTP